MGIGLGWLSSIERRRAGSIKRLKSRRVEKSERRTRIGPSEIRSACF